MHTSLRKILALAFSAQVVMGICSFGAVFYLSKSVLNSFEQVALVEGPAAEATYEMEINVIGSALGVMKYLSRPDPSFRERVLKDQKDFKQFHARYSSLAATEEKALAETVGRLNQELFRLGLSLMDDRDSLELAWNQERTVLIQADSQVQQELAAARARRSSDVPRLVALGEALGAVEHTLRGFLLDPPRSEALRKELDEALARLEGAASLPRGGGPPAELISAVRAGADEVAGLEVRIEAGRRELIDRRRSLDDLLDERIQVISQQHLVEAQATVERHLDQLILVIGVTSLMFILTISAAGKWLWTGVHVPLEKLLGRVKGVIKGQPHQAIAYETIPLSEVRVLASAFNRMTAHLEATTVSKKRLEESQRELEKTVEAREQAAQEWRATFDSFDSAILIVAADGRISRANRAAGVGLERRVQDLIGLRAKELGTGEPWETIAAISARLSEGGEVDPVEVRDAVSQRLYLVACMRMHGSSGEAILQARDITSVEALREELIQSKPLADMGKFVAGIAHEVRNPLFGILANVESLEGEPDLASVFGDYARRIRDQSRRLIDLMQDLLEYARPVSPDATAVSLREVVESVATEEDALLGQAGVSVIVDEEDGPALVWADERGLMTVFRNLIENASSFAPDGSVVHVRVRPEASGRVECVLEDSGPGFPTENLSEVFAPFFTRRRGGTGMGLAIVRRIVEDHGGSVGVENREEGGARVSVLLPACDAT